MKKTISINIANRSFYIEEEAYNMLNAYLQGIELHYRATDSDGEIVGDIEERLSEIFDDRKRLGHEVITVEITREAMRQMGPLEDIIDEPLVGHHAEHATQGEGSGRRNYRSKPDGEAGAEHKVRKLYKDPTDKWLTGLMGGLSKYAGLDPLFVRIIFVLLLFTPVNWALILLYIACAIFIPTAHTVTQRLEMEGTAVNPDSIWKKVNEESALLGQNVTSRLNDLGRTFRITRDPAAREAAAEQTQEEQADSKKKKKTSGIIYSIVGIGVVIALVLSLIWLITILSTGDFYSTDYWDGFFETAIFSGTGILLLTSIVIISLLVVGGLFALAMLPIGLILRSKSAPAWKVIGIIIWVIIIYAIFLNN